MFFCPQSSHIVPPVYPIPLGGLCLWNQTVAFLPFFLLPLDFLSGFLSVKVSHSYTQKSPQLRVDHQCKLSRAIQKCKTAFHPLCPVCEDSDPRKQGSEAGIFLKTVVSSPVQVQHEWDGQQMFMLEGLQSLVLQVKFVLVYHNVLLGYWYSEGSEYEPLSITLKC